MPTSEELAKLVDAIGRHFPALLDTQGPAFEGTRHDRRQQWLKQFAASFEAIGHMKRMDRPDTGKYLSFHISVAESVLKSFGRPSLTLRGNAFLAACLAHGYVPVAWPNVALQDSGRR